MKVNSKDITKLVVWLKEQGPVIYLESQMTEHPSSQKSYIAGLPESWIKIGADRCSWAENVTGIAPDTDSWTMLRQYQNYAKNWIFGYAGYDLKNDIEELESVNAALMDVPDLFFFAPSFLAEIDLDGNMRLIHGEYPDIPENIEPEEPEVRLRHRISKEEYLRVIEEAQRDIFEGEYYEINLSHPLVFDFTGESWVLYQRMKNVGPVPFGGFLSFDDVSICCSSPERFLAKKGSRVWSQPIKGTASREHHEHGQIEQLKNSEKDRAENLMIVDLVRNDLSHFAQRGSVQVKDLFEIQSFETVHQMVSTVECQVGEETHPVDILKACFPMGSMTGAPKIATMQAIERLENYKRGIYSGAMGYISPEGDFDFNVLIRSALIQGQQLVYPVGGAITSDSEPEKEWDETLIKARAITNSIKTHIS
ncbi:MAG: anthranilate synthase component I family protein [Balneolaceae bacterium]|nr:anthranilate synthase component I family protein [Balneolaceae bacterium]